MIITTELVTFLYLLLTIGHSQYLISLFFTKTHTLTRHYSDNIQRIRPGNVKVSLSLIIAYRGVIFLITWIHALCLTTPTFIGQQSCWATPKFRGHGVLFAFVFLVNIFKCLSCFISSFQKCISVIWRENKGTSIFQNITL